MRVTGARCFLELIASNWRINKCKGGDRMPKTCFCLDSPNGISQIRDSDCNC